MKQIRRRLTFANVVACLALFVALGGASYAATQLPKNSVGSKQIKKNAVNSSKVKNHSLKAVDFKAGQLPAGKEGKEGKQGPQGEPGASATAMWGLINSNGTLAHGSGITSVAKVGLLAGEYEVDFGTNLTQCSWQVTLDGDLYGIAATQIRFGNPDAVFVKTATTAGTVTPIPFDIAVFC